MKRNTITVKKEYSVDRKKYSTEMEYAAACRDLEKIKKLQAKIADADSSAIEMIYKQLASGACRFETSLGMEFDDDIYELVMQNRQNKVKPDTTADKSAGRLHKKLSSDKHNHKSGFTDEELKPMIEKELKKAESRRKLMIGCFLLIGLGCLAYFILYHYGSNRSDNRFQELSELIGSDALKTSQEQKPPVVHLTDTSVEIPDILPEYETLYNSNKKLIGWIEIDDTKIDYPVLQCGDNTYYLNHNFDQEEDRNGSIFLDYRCDVIQGNDNYILYGHHMSSGKMFAALEKYENREFYEKHPYIRFDTIYEKQTFQVMYVFRSRVYNEDDVVFKYYDFIDVNSENEFMSYMREMEEETFYNTGVTAVYGDQLLTLSTCDYNEKNGRFVVVAKRIE